MTDINRVILRDAAKDQWLEFSDPLEIIEIHRTDDVINGLCRVEDAVLHRGLHAAGMISYEAAPAFDPSLAVLADGCFPLLWFGIYEQPSIIDIPKYDGLEMPDVLQWASSVSSEEYRHAFERIKDYIGRGDTYQVNYTFRLQSDFPVDPWQYFVRLISAQGSGYGAYINTGRWTVCSASPEVFFTLEGSRMESRPMKGTAARGLTLEQDHEQARSLKVSEKNRAENLMIVDMVRNDMGRIAEGGSVHVSSLFDIEKYPTLWQMTSTVRAETDVSLTGIFRAMFPPASITGAPKNRTMQIIAELETTPRRIYTGSIGFISPGRRAQFNVAIRTLLVNAESGRAEYGVGGGIVWDSDCAMEQLECRTKSRILNAGLRPFSLLETMLWTPAQGYYLLDRHMRRLGRSAEYFDYRLDIDSVRKTLDCIAQDLPQADQRIRLLIANDGGISCEVYPIVPDDSASVKNVALACSPVDRSSPFLYHKTTNRRIYEDALAACPGYDDVILCNESGEVTESTIANIVVELDGVLYTPPVRCGLLPGTYREWMLEEKMVMERVITVRELMESSGVYLVNSVRGMYKVKISSADAI